MADFIRITGTNCYLKKIDKLL